MYAEPDEMAAASPRFLSNPGLVIGRAGEAAPLGMKLVARHPGKRLDKGNRLASRLAGHVETLRQVTCP